LTQADLGQLIGVGQARIAEIENNPGVVSMDQLMKVLSALRASLILHDEGAQPTASTSNPPVSGIAGRIDADPHLDIQAPPRRNHIIHPKKGSW
jgi:HTH-type transcriptional regulator/antitoxin HipB